MHQAILQPLMCELEVECLPRDIPEVITVDLADLDIGRVLHANALSLPPGVTLVTDAEEPVVTTEREDAGQTAATEEAATPEA